MGAGVDLAIGVVDAAGNGQNVGGRSEKVGPAAEVFKGTFCAGKGTFCAGNSPDPPPARVEDTPSGTPLAECIWVTTLHPTSFASTWLVSGRGHLPGLVSDPDGGRMDEFKGVGITANSSVLKTELSRANG